MVYAVPAVSWARAGGGPREEFFRSAAEVIPVLVLALALEGRHFDWSASRLPIVRAVNIMALLSLVAGEVAAFAVLSNGRVTRLESGLTTAALLSAAGMLVIMAVAGPARRPD